MLLLTHCACGLCLKTPFDQEQDVHMGTKRPKRGHIRAFVLYMCACPTVKGRIVLYNLIRCRGIHFWSQKWHGTSRTHRKLHRKLVKLELYTIIGARARSQHARKHACSVDSARYLQTSYSHVFGFKLTLFHVKAEAGPSLP